MMKVTDSTVAFEAALKANADYSMGFTQEVQTLCSRIEDALSAKLEHDDDMNYSSSQKLVLCLDAKCEPVMPSDPMARYRLTDFVSSKGRYFAFVTHKQSVRNRGEPQAVWVVVENRDVPEGIKAIQKRIAGVMRSERYTLLEGPILSRVLKGRFTELDKKPANVFEVLFSELT